MSLIDWMHLLGRTKSKDRIKIDYRYYNAKSAMLLRGSAQKF